MSSQAIQNNLCQYLKAHWLAEPFVAACLSCSSLPSVSSLSSRYVPVFTRTGREESWLAGWTVACAMGLLRGIASDLEFPCVRSSGDDIMHILHCGSLSVHKCQLYAQETEEGK